ncbi:anthranilate phosphoribosyltransferase [Podochytrium sp. JEL0797]|nr:anthranilate phosphoribosyltransferase [Podochytrium sp. JEL0797]
MTSPGAKHLRLLLENPTAFTAQHADETTRGIMHGELTAAQAGAFLAALKLTGKDRDPHFIAAVATAMRACAREIRFERELCLVDIVGTGGDGQDTFNVSTASAIVAAGAGCSVAKHGNRSSSSQCGSADVLEHLGANLNNITPEKIERIVTDSQFCFLFAQLYHPSMKTLAGPRKELGVKTIFNILGPLTNPAFPMRMIVGVFSKEIGPIMAESLRLSGVERAWIVHGAIGLDEIAPTGETHVWSLENNTITPLTIHPTRDFGLPENPLASVRGGDGAYNSTTMRQLLDNTLPAGHPVLDFVLLNSAALLYVAGRVKGVKEGVEVARESLRSGSAKRALEAFVRQLLDNALPASQPVLGFVLLNIAALYVAGRVGGEEVEVARESLRSGRARGALEAFVRERNE